MKKLCHKFFYKCKKSFNFSYDKEKKLAEQMLDPVSKSKLIELIYFTLVEKNQSILLFNIISYVKKNDIESLSTIIKLFCYNQKGQEILVEVFNQKFITSFEEEFSEMIKAKKDSEKIVDGILNWYNLIQNSFNKYLGGIGTCLTNKITAVIKNLILKHEFENSISKWIHKYVSRIGCIPEEESEQFFWNINILISLISQKAFFELCYQKHLQERLIKITTKQQLVPEQRIINIFKVYTVMDSMNKLSNQIKDIKQSFSLNYQFQHFSMQKKQIQFKRENISDLGAGNLEIRYLLLAEVFWNFDKEVHDCQLPKEIKRARSSFEEFFHLKFKSRSLKWRLDQGTAMIKFRTDKTRYLEMGKLHAIICLQFNETEKMTIKNLKEKLGIKIAELVRCLMALLKAKILTCEPENEALESMSTNTVLIVNKKFTNKRLKLRIKNKAFLEKKVDEATVQRFYIEKETRIESQIMKIMKSERKIEFDRLFKKVCLLTENLYKVSRVDVMKGVESLLNKEYILRGKENLNQLLYN